MPEPTEGVLAFGRWPRWAVAALLLATGTLIVAGFVQEPLRGPADVSIEAGTHAYSDGQLYLDIARRVGAGEPYHEAAVDVQAEHNYPTRPFVTVRPPALTFVTAAVGSLTGLRILIGALWVAVMIVGVRSFGQGSRFELWAGSLLLALGTGAVFFGESAALHESWAGLLVALGLLLWRPNRWWPVVALVTVASLVRELAIPVLVLLAVFAVGQRRWRETWGIAAAVVAVGGCLVVHAVLATQAAEALAVSQASPGWLTLNGWPNPLRTVSRSSLLPYAATVALVPLGLFGWVAVAARGDQVAVRVAAFVGCCVAALTIVGQPVNEYWGRLFAGLLLAGVAYVPRGVAEAAKRLRISAPPTPG